MLLRILGIASAVALMSLAAGAQTPPSSAEHETPKNYVPGLEQFMEVIQNEHAKLWYAGQARNWKLAAYQLGEIKEVMSDVQDLVPTFKNLPLAQMLDSVITGPVAQLEKSLDEKTSKSFPPGIATSRTHAIRVTRRRVLTSFVSASRSARHFPTRILRRRGERLDWRAGR